MKINILTLFPKLIDTFLDNAIVRRAINNKILEINIVNIRSFINGHNVDDYAFGGGAGMVIKKCAIDPFFKSNKSFNIFTSPQGVKLDNRLARSLAEKTEITILCGHYEGVDERAIEDHVDLEVSIGDYILTGGELPSLVILDSIMRFVPNFISKDSYENDSFESSSLDYSVYTRPQCERVPKELLSGNHSLIEEYRKKDSLYRTLIKRPDLVKELPKEDKILLKQMIERALDDIS